MCEGANDGGEIVVTIQALIKGQLFAEKQTERKQIKGFEGQNRHFVRKQATQDTLQASQAKGY